MSDEHNYHFLCEALQNQVGNENAIVTHWSGTERVSKPYRYEIVLAVKDASVALESLLNMPATLTANVPDGTMKWHGIITQASQEGHDDVYDFYKIVLEPRVARLRSWRWSDIYLNQQLDDIVISLLKIAQLTQPYVADDQPYDYRIAATGMAATKQEFVCQFDESCLDFLMRKLEHYGVYFWFEQGDTQESIVFANDASQQPQEAISAVHYARGTLDTESREIAITRIDRHVGMSVDKVTLHDSPEHGNTLIDLTASQNLSGPSQRLGEYHSHSDQFTSVSGDNVTSGAVLANWRAQELLCASQQIKGQVRTPGITPGYPLTVQEYRRSASPGDYYVIQISHEGYQTLETSRKNDEPPYRGSFVALPRWTKTETDKSPLQFRPQRTTPLPRIMYMVNGFVDTETPGAPKRYAQMDPTGRYKVRFCFARQRYGGDKNSAYLRMATPYAGGASSADTSGNTSNAGMHFPLREGTEVLISFLNGDPDRPVIMSALSNSEAPSVVNSSNASEYNVTTSAGSTVKLSDSTVQPSGSDGGTGESILLSTPSGSTVTTPISSLNLGASDDPALVDGFHLKTQGHGEIHADSSMLIEVPGHLRMAAGGGAGGSFLSSLVQNTPAWLTIGQSGGVVISNFIGANIQNTAGLSIQNYVGAKFDFAEAGALDVYMGYKRSVVLGWATEYTFPKKTALHDNSNVTFLNGTRTGLTWKSTLVSRLDNITDWTTNALVSYQVASPSVTIGSPVGGLTIEGLALAQVTSLTGSMTNVSSTTSTEISGAASVSISSGISNITATPSLLSSEAVSLEFTAADDISVAGTQIFILGTIIELG